MIPSPFFLDLLEISLDPKVAAMRSRIIRRTAVVLMLTAGTLVLSGCAQIVEGFNNLQGGANHVTPTEQPSADEEGSAPMVFDSLFTRDGSVSLSSDVAEELELRLDVWAAEPKRTMEWHPEGPKSFGFAVNVYDHRVDEKAILAQKRRVYISQISISSQTSQTSLQSSAPFQFSADPRTLVPADTLRSDRGLLLNSYQGGLLVPSLTINQLPKDAYGIMLQFAITVTVEGAASDETSFQQQMVYQTLPIAIAAAEGQSSTS